MNNDNYIYTIFFIMIIYYVWFAFVGYEKAPPT